MNLENAVVVVTGASSGIGRATALAFAREHAKVIVCSRRTEKVEEVAEEIAWMEGESLALSCDVSVAAAVSELADLVVDRYGRIDVWVNNAAVTAAGRIDEMPEDVFRQVIETNLIGYGNGARAAIRHFRKQGKGILINVASIAGKIGQPFMSAYCASKFGIIGLSDSLRMELRHDPEIHVCTVCPVGTDTPLFQHAANYCGFELKPPSPVYAARHVADAIVDLALRPRREVTIGAGKVMGVVRAMAPGLAEQWVARKTERQHFTQESTPPTKGSVLVSAGDAFEIDGHWMSHERGSSLPSIAMIAGTAALGAFAVYGISRLLASDGQRMGRPENASEALPEQRNIPVDQQISAEEEYTTT